MLHKKCLMCGKEIFSVYDFCSSCDKSKCLYCNKRIRVATSFCPHCGKNIDRQYADTFADTLINKEQDLEERIKSIRELLESLERKLANSKLGG